MTRVTIRRATRSDTEGFLGLLTALANFERLTPPDAEGERRIVNDLFLRHRLGLFIATVENRQVGYALYFYSYSSFLARPTLYLEDIFVLEEHRGKGIGESLFRRCVREAISSGCGRMEWAVLTWNTKAIDFYEKIGAKRLDEWHVFRLTSDQFEGIVEAGGRARPRQRQGVLRPYDYMEKKTAPG